jgi:hypothetical protein
METLSLIAQTLTKDAPLPGVTIPDYIHCYVNKGHRPVEKLAKRDDIAAGAREWIEGYGKIGRSEEEALQAFLIGIVAQDKMRMIRGMVYSDSSEPDNWQHHLARLAELGKGVGEYFVGSSDATERFQTVLTQLANVDTEFPGAKPYSKHGDTSSIWRVFPLIFPEIISTDSARYALRMSVGVNRSTSAAEPLTAESGVLSGEIGIAGIASTGFLLGCVLTAKLSQLTQRDLQCLPIIPTAAESWQHIVIPNALADYKRVLLVEDAVRYTFRMVEGELQREHGIEVV